MHSFFREIYILVLFSASSCTKFTERLSVSYSLDKSAVGRDFLYNQLQYFIKLHQKMAHVAYLCVLGTLHLQKGKYFSICQQLLKSEHIVCCS